MIGPIQLVLVGIYFGFGFWSAILLPMAALSVSKRLWAFLLARKEG